MAHFMPILILLRFTAAVMVMLELLIRIILHFLHNTQSKVNGVVLLYKKIQ